MRRIFIPLTVLALTFAVACTNKTASNTASSGNNGATTVAQSSTSTPLSSTTSLSPEELGTLGAQIKKQPNDANKLLADKGLNVQSFAAAVRKVSENPADAKRYTAAYKSST
jgi:hypothetical protein